MAKQQKSLFDFFAKKNESSAAVAVEAAAAAANERGMGKEELPLVVLSSSVAPNSAPTASTAFGVTPSAGESSRADSNETVPPRADAEGRRSNAALGTCCGAKRWRSAVQTSLDFGQSDAGGVTKCRLCGMVFNATVKEDVCLHARCCTALSSSSPSPSWAKKSRCGTEATDAWLASELLGKSLESMVHHQRRGAAKAPARCSSGDFCVRLPESVDDEFMCYVFDCSKRGFAEDAVAIRLAEALRFPDVVLPAAAYCLVVMLHRRAGRLLCAVAGRPSTREQDPALVVRRDKDGTTTRCGTRTCVTFCDVPYVWCQRDAVLAASASDWWPARTVAALQSTGAAVRDFFSQRGGGHAEEQQQRLHTLVDAALHRSVMALGRHVVYGHALSPRAQFSYDNVALREDVLDRVAAVTACDNDGEDASPLFTHAGGCGDVANDAESELSVVSYGD
ncbi:hypothetical protein DQ04_00821030 [Trypanosoma grayi]|uniref:hypothetical protein n=1 Tax=Trypanosoma grayi TaxID=71804 RepID=UPI0004F48D8A|nr:hypothetical protein DQ04_00821030 [Trypanosoma grayi]KEG13725.1 hypothetical protein DQ04_00821030 [Trypanosoma grayi]